MKAAIITEKDKALAQKCIECKVCTSARTKQKGLAFWFVKTVEGSLCPNCKAYERVYGRKAHEPLPKMKQKGAAKGSRPAGKNKKK
ncbi:MAG: hypothetical protein PHY31_08320 [Smithellaceae bacterium]|nr:hypothetical protein [Smithellaceae bacterium]